MAARPTLLMIGARGIGGFEGGVEKFAEEFARRACGHFAITAVALSPTCEELAGRIETVVARKSAAFNTDKLHYYWSAILLALTRRFDHVLILGINFAMIGALARLLFWRRTRIAVRTGSIDYTLEKWSTALKYFIRASEGAMRFADTVIAVSPFIAHHLERRGISAILLRNGLGTPCHGAGTVARELRKILAVGRVTRQKNYEVLLKASALLGDCDLDIGIIGGPDASRESELLSALAGRNPSIRVTFYGAVPRDDVMRKLASAGLYVNCSIHEGMSNAVLEAIQQRIPVILSDIEANRDLGLPPHHYFDPRSPEALAMKIREALREPDNFTAPVASFLDWDRVVGRAIEEIAVKARDMETRARKRMKGSTPASELMGSED